MGTLFGGGALEPEIAYLWPCNVQAWQAWCAVQSQWRSGAAGRDGLDYAGVCAYLQVVGLCGDERRSIFAGIQAAEHAALEVWAEQRRLEDENKKL